MSQAANPTTAATVAAAISTRRRRRVMRMPRPPIALPSHSTGAACSPRMRVRDASSMIPTTPSPVPRPRKPRGMNPMATPTKKVEAGMSRPTISSHALTRYLNGSAAAGM